MELLVGILKVFGYRTIKTAIGVSISVLIAQSLQVEYYSAAGILTLLCIQKSRKQSKHAALTRFYACMLGLFISSALFELLGYQPYSFLVLLLLFIPLSVALRVQEGIASSSVIMMHVYMHKQVEAAFYLNELLVVVIGLGVALLINWYMPSIDKQLDALKRQTDQLIATILKEYANYLLDGYTMWDGREVLHLSDLLRRAKRLALLDSENHKQRKNNKYMIYFENKQKQFDLLERMLPSISQITSQMEQGERIGKFLLKLSNGFSDVQEDGLHEELRSIREYHKQLPLPLDRCEFENRAHLFTIGNDLERFVDTM
ncbi:aromatic acid exporter family protein [Paenibacillaceae bacterium]|nr:aromatic acid exporter family protein [Paenibacillaceae bacterium]